MPALSYKSQFVEYVEAGLQTPLPKDKRIKRQTIRNFRKNPIKPGDTLYHYFAQRSKWCRKLGESKCKSAQEIIITIDSVIILNDNTIVCQYDDKRSLNRFAYRDGFSNWEEMRKWWVVTHQLAYNKVFTGQLIKW